VAALEPLDIVAIVDRVLDTSAATVLPDPPILSDTTAGWWDRYVAMVQAWVDRMRTTETPIVEKMTLFWHGHFCSSLEAVGDHVMLWRQNQLFRALGLSDFRTLTQRVAVDPAMLRYLNNDRNVVGAPNENFARELMELFTLGANRYTQDDVGAAARAWTGHGIDKDGQYAFTSRRHDAGLKTFFGTTKSWDGPDIVEEIVGGSTREVSARFIATKLWTFFAYPDPEPAVIDGIAAAYLADDLRIRSALRALFLRQEFYSPRAVRQQVRAPIDYVVATMRSANLPASDAHPEWWLDDMGQAPFQPPNVAGWKPNGYWISASAQTAKATFAGNMRWVASKRGLLADTSRLRPGDAVRYALQTFGVDRPSPTTVRAMERWLTVERTKARWAEQPNLIMLALLSPDMQLA